MGIIMRRATGLILFILMAISFGTLGCTKAEQKEEFEVGAVLSLTGKAASYGEWGRKGITIAVEQSNKNPESRVHFRVIQEDSQGDPKLAVSAMEKLISVNKVPVIIGFITSSEFLTVAPIAEKKKVVIITPVAGAPLERSPGSYVFRTREDGSSQSVIVADYIYNTLKVEKASVIYENAANAVAYKDIFVEKFMSTGGQIDQILSYDEDQRDFRSILTKIKAHPVEAVYLPGVAKIVGHILVQAKELGLETKFFSSAGIEDPELFRIAGEEANGLVYGAPTFSLDIKSTHVRQFIDAYRSRFNEDPSVYAANAYDAMMLIIKAIKNGKHTADEIKSFLYEVVDYPGASGVISFEENGDVIKPVVLKRIVDKQFQPISQ